MTSLIDPSVIDPAVYPHFDLYPAAASCFDVYPLLSKPIIPLSRSHSQQRKAGAFEAAAVHAQGWSHVWPYYTAHVLTGIQDSLRMMTTLKSCTFLPLIAIAFIDQVEPRESQKEIKVKLETLYPDISLCESRPYLLPRFIHSSPILYRSCDVSYIRGLP